MAINVDENGRSIEPCVRCDALPNNVSGRDGHIITQDGRVCDSCYPNYEKERDARYDAELRADGWSLPADAELADLSHGDIVTVHGGGNGTQAAVLLYSEPNRHRVLRWVKSRSQFMVSASWRYAVKRGHPLADTVAQEFEYVGWSGRRS